MMLEFSSTSTTKTILRDCTDSRLAGRARPQLSRLQIAQDPICGMTVDVFAARDASNPLTSRQTNTRPPLGADQVAWNRLVWKAERSACSISRLVSLEQRQESVRRVAKMLVFVANLEVRELGINSRQRNAYEGSSDDLSLHHALGLNRNS